MSARSFALGSVVLGLVVSLAAACDGETTANGGSVNDGGGGTDSAIADGAAPRDGGAVDSGLYPTDATKILFTSKGGGPLPPPPDGSVCQQVDITYTILLPSRELSWQVCEAGDGGAYGYRTGQKTLTAEQFAGVEATFRALTRTTTVKCGADKPLEQLTFTRPSGETTYYDDFYFCDVNDPKLYVAGMEDVFTAITLLAQ